MQALWLSTKSQLISDQGTHREFIASYLLNLQLHVVHKQNTFLNQYYSFTYVNFIYIAIPDKLSHTIVIIEQPYHVDS